MALPHLHIFHPTTTVAPHLPEWLAAVEQLLRAEADWDGCRLHRLEFNTQAGFDVPTAIDHVNRNRGPVIFIQKVEAATLHRFRTRMQRRVSIYPLSPCCAEDIWQACEAAKKGFENGEPLIPLRELLAYLIVRKLERQGKWGGTALYKSFLGADDLPNGGFPKAHCTVRDIMEVADALVNAGVLSRKVGDGQQKYALGDKSVIQPILDNKSFEGIHKLQNYFDRGKALVPASLLDYND